MWSSYFETGPDRATLSNSKLALQVQFSSVAQVCLTLCDPMDCCKSGFCVHHQCPELTQIHIHQVSDAIHPPYPLLSPSPLAFNFPIIRVFINESVLRIGSQISEFQLQHKFFQWIFSSDFLYDGLVGSPCSPRDSQESFIKSLLLSFLYRPTLTSMHDH